jgi:hypothetical protein
MFDNRNSYPRPIAEDYKILDENANETVITLVLVLS